MYRPSLVEREIFFSLVNSREKKMRVSGCVVLLLSFLFLKKIIIVGKGFGKKERNLKIFLETGF